MKNNLLFGLALALSGAWFGCSSQVKPQANALPDLSQYPQTEAFRFFVGSQTNRAFQLAATNLLTITSFHGDDRTTLNYCVRQDGYETDYRWVYNYAVQAIHQKELSADNMKSLRAAIAKLPAQNEHPPIGRLVIVSFSSGTNWVTRRYDSQAPPEALRKIYHIIQP